MSALVERLLDSGTTVAAVGAGVSGGVLFAFSTFVMRALDRLPAERAIETMQSINREAPNPAFMAVLLGTGGVAAVVGVGALRRLDGAEGRLVVVASALYLASLLVTIAFHIPRNDRLARVATPAADAVEVWHRYASAWTTGNHVRAGLAIAAALLFTVARGLARSG